MAGAFPSKLILNISFAAFSAVWQEAPVQLLEDVSSPFLQKLLLGLLSKFAARLVLSFYLLVWDC